MRWTDERLELLKKWWAEGHSCTIIARRLGDTTRGAVAAKVHRLNLPPRPTLTCIPRGYRKHPHWCIPNKFTPGRGGILDAEFDADDCEYRPINPNDGDQE